MFDREMNGTDDTRSEEEVREETIDELLESNDLGDLTRMRREMHDELKAASDDRETELIEYRLSILNDAIDRVTE
jgi:hypothetical protein